MGKGKVSTQLLFISYANSALARKDILDLVKSVSIERQLNNRKDLEKTCDIEIIENFKPDKPDRLEEFRKFHELFFKKIYFPLKDEEKRQMALSYTRSIRGGKLAVVNEQPDVLKRDGERLSNVEELNRDLYPNGYEEIGIMFQFLYSVKSSQLNLQEILKKVISKSPPEKKTFETITKYFNDVQTKTILQSGKTTYLEKISEFLLVGDKRIYKDPFLLFKKIVEPTIYYTLVNFLCSEAWIKLHQCRWCEKFWVAKTKRKQYVCSVKCKNDYHYKKRRESGKNNEYIREWRLKNPNMY